MLGELWPQSTLEGLFHLENVNDSSGNARNLTNNNTVAFNKSKFTDGADAGNSNTNKSLTSSNLFNTTVNSGRTMGCWVKINTELSGGDTFPSLFNLGYDANDVAYSLNYWRSGSANKFSASRQRASVASENITMTINAGTVLYYFLVLSLSGTTLSLYVNGCLIGTATANTGNGSGGSYENGIHLFKSPDSTTFQSAKVDEAFIFSSVWSAFRVRQQYGISTGKWQ